MCSFDRYDGKVDEQRVFKSQVLRKLYYQGESDVIVKCGHSVIKDFMSEAKTFFKGKNMKLFQGQLKV